MMIIGCDLHTRFQQIAMLDTETGEIVERRVGFVKADVSRSSRHEVFTFKECFLPCLTTTRILAILRWSELHQPSMRSCAFRP
jgi:hypothetical protein